MEQNQNKPEKEESDIIMPMDNNINNNASYSQRGLNRLASDCLQVPEKNPLVTKFPKNLMLEVTNACNLKCTTCYNPKMRRAKGFMEVDLYKKILIQAKDVGIEMIGLYTTGEAFLHPKIFDFIRLAKDMAFKYVYITTNGLLLNEDRIDRIFASGLDSIKFSIDAASAETYKIVRPPGDFDRLLRNIKILKQKRDENKSPLKIYSSFILTKDNYHELREFQKFWEPWIDEISIHHVTNQSNLQSEEFEKLSVRKNKHEVVEDKVCNFLWNRMIVTYDGQFTLCTEDFEGELIYGNIQEETMRESWNNKKMQGFRRAFVNKDYSCNKRCEGCNTRLVTPERTHEELKLELMQ